MTGEVVLYAADESDVDKHNYDSFDDVKDAGDVGDSK